MSVCGECSSLGEVKGDLSERKQRLERVEDRVSKNSSPVAAATWSGSERMLKKDYGREVKKARENKNLTMEELSKKISVKKSVIRRIENEDLKPDGKISEKLERELDIELYDENEENSFESGGQNENLTIGDVTEVK